MHRRNQVSKYLKTKTGSLESAVLEAVSRAQQAAIAIAKKEKEEMDEKANFSDKEIKMAIGVASDKRYKGGNYTGAVNAIEKIAKGLSDHPQVKAVLKRQNEKLDKVNPNAVKKDFDDRKDKDIDNDGDVDDSDEYLHNRRKAISKDVKEEVSLAQLAAQHITDMWKESAYGAKKKVDKKEEMDDNEDEGDGKTMTGKPMSKIDVNPQTKEK